MHLSTLLGTAGDPFRWGPVGTLGSSQIHSLGSAPLFCGGHFSVPHHSPSLGVLSFALWADSVATRQNSTSGRPKSPRIQVVLPEDLCERLGVVAEAEARTVSNMARVLIQQGLEVYEQQQAALRAAAAPAPAASPTPVARRTSSVRTSSSRGTASGATAAEETDSFRQALEQQEQAEPKRLRGAPRRLRLNRPRA